MHVFKICEKFGGCRSCSWLSQKVVIPVSFATTYIVIENADMLVGSQFLGSLVLIYSGMVTGWYRG